MSDTEGMGSVYRLADGEEVISLKPGDAGIFRAVLDAINRPKDES